MDSGVDTTQRIVIGIAIFLGIAIVLVIGYSLYNKAKTAAERHTKARFRRSRSAITS